MPSNSPPLRVPTPDHELALDELHRIGIEGARVLSRAGAVVGSFERHRERVTSDDAVLLREARRDIERCRIVLEGVMRRHRIEVSP